MHLACHRLSHIRAKWLDPTKGVSNPFARSPIFICPTCADYVHLRPLINIVFRPLRLPTSSSFFLFSVPCFPFQPKSRASHPVLLSKIIFIVFIYMMFSKIIISWARVISVLLLSRFTTHRHTKIEVWNGSTTEELNKEICCYSSEWVLVFFFAEQKWGLVGWYDGAE